MSIVFLIQVNVGILLGRSHLGNQLAVIDDLVEWYFLVTDGHHGHLVIIVIITVQQLDVVCVTRKIKSRYIFISVWSI